MLEINEENLSECTIEMNIKPREAGSLNLQDRFSPGEHRYYNAYGSSVPEARFFSLYRAKKERRKIDMILQRSILLSLFVFLSEDSLKESLLLYRNLKSASGALDLGNVDAADYHLDFLLYGKNFPNTLASQARVIIFGPTLALTMGSLFQRSHLGVCSITWAGRPDCDYLQLLFINYQHADRLSDRSHLFLLDGLAALRLLSEEIKGDQSSNQYYNDNNKNNS